MGEPGLAQVYNNKCRKILGDLTTILCNALKTHGKKRHDVHVLSLFQYPEFLFVVSNLDTGDVKPLNHQDANEEYFLCTNQKNSS